MAWIAADQALASLANAGLTIVIARTVTSEEYGAFALAFSVYSLVIALTQGVSGQVFAIGYSGEDRPTQVRAGATAGASAVAFAGGCAAVALLVAVFLGSPLREVLLAVGVLLPALALQDTWRAVFVARGTPAQAFLNDLLWVSLQAAGVAALLVVGVHTAFPFVAAWSMAALVAGLVGIQQNGQTPAFGHVRRWFTGHREVSLPSLASSLATLGTVQIAFVLIAAAGAVEDVGALRAAQTLLGPLNILSFAALSFVVPELVRRKLSPSGLVKVAVGSSAILVTIAATWGAILLLLPDSAGEFILGATWPNARSAIPGMAMYTCLILATVGAAAVMRALNRINLLFWVSATLGPLVLVLSVLGARMDGASGAAAGFAIAAAVVAPLCWGLMIRAVRLGRREVASLVDEAERLPDSPFG